MCVSSTVHMYVYTCTLCTCVLDCTNMYNKTASIINSPFFSPSLPLPPSLSLPLSPPSPSSLSLLPLPPPSPSLSSLPPSPSCSPLYSERLKEDTATYDKTYHSLLDQHKALLQRASEAEVTVISTRREIFVKPATIKLQELDKMWYVIIVCYVH